VLRTNQKISAVARLLYSKGAKAKSFFIISVGVY
jgi:hypothetical protein